MAQTAPKREYSIGQVVNTKNGPGTFEGFGGEDKDDERYKEMYIGGFRHFLIRHTLSKMTSQAHGVCITPNAKQSGLWMYEEGEVK